MIRPIFTELVLFLAPFAAYAAFLFFTKSKVLDRFNWPPKILLTLTMIALLLVIGSFIAIAHFSGASPGTTYEPAHMENGKFVPGRVIP